MLGPQQPLTGLHATQIERLGFFVITHISVGIGQPGQAAEHPCFFSVCCFFKLQRQSSQAQQQLAVQPCLIQQGSHVIHKPDQIRSIFLPLCYLLLHGFFNQLIQLTIALSPGEPPVVDHLAIVTLSCQLVQLADPQQQRSKVIGSACLLQLPGELLSLAVIPLALHSIPIRQHAVRLASLLVRRQVPVLHRNAQIVMVKHQAVAVAPECLLQSQIDRCPLQMLEIRDRQQFRFRKAGPTGP